MGKIRIYLIVILCTIIIMNLNVNSAFVMKDSSHIINAYKNNTLVRLHVLANSNAPADQYIKRKIRNQVLNYMGKFSDAEKFKLDSKLTEINNYINKSLELEGVDYKAAVELGSYDFPDRTYGDFTLPAGNYNALKIVLGSGKGSNWWCVLLPPMCIEDQVEEDVDPEQIEFRFKLIEWIQSKFNRDMDNMSRENDPEGIGKDNLGEVEISTNKDFYLMTKYDLFLNIEKELFSFRQRDEDVIGDAFYDLNNQDVNLLEEDNDRFGLTNIVKLSISI